MMKRLIRATIVATLILSLGACNSAAKKEEEEIARNTYACTAKEERIVIRFERGEARLLMPSGERVSLYQVPSGSGVRYTNGSMDLFGKGTDLRLARDGAPAEALEGCAPLMPPAPPGPTVPPK